MHGKCQRLKTKRERAVASGRWEADKPTAYDVAAEHVNKDDLNPEVPEALRKRQAQLEEDRKLEEVPKRESDWRDPVEAELE